MLPRARAVRHPLSGTPRRLRRPAAWLWAVALGVGVLAWSGLRPAEAGWAEPAREDPEPEDEPALDSDGEDLDADAPREPEPDPDPATETDPGGVEAGEGLPSVDEATLAGPTLQDAVLPCGLRVIVAQDDTLPVTAVVLALETGTEDDPPTQPGLVHALAYQLLQGNRELRPGGAAALVHDQGGITSLAVGPAQVRFETLAPSSALDDVLWIESQRLRAPTVSAELWANTLRWARRDGSRTWRAPRAAMAAAHGAPGLEHDGRTVTPAITSMVPRAIGQALAERFHYEQATLVVVSPHPPATLRPRIEALFSDLPAQPRRARDRSPRWRTGSVPQPLPVAGESGVRLVWPVAPDPAALGQATVWCKAINRQRRLPREPSRARLRCHLDVDPRRATLVLHAHGVDDPKALVQARIDRLERGEDRSLVDRQRVAVAHAWVLELRMPLPLAQRLAAAGPALQTEPGWRERPVDALTGLAELQQPWGARGFGPHLQAGAAIHLVPQTAEPATPEEATP